MRQVLKKSISTFLFGFLLAAAGIAFGAAVMSPASFVSVSSITTTPTRIVAPTAGTANIQIKCVQYLNPGERIMIQSSSATWSTSDVTGTFRIPCLSSNTLPAILYLDNYSGPVWAVAIASYAVPVGVLRTK